jgi:mRNA interferase MazF
MTWAGAPGNVLLPAKVTGLPKDSVANVSQIIALDRSFLTEQAGRLTPKHLVQVLHGIDVMLGR